MQHSQLRAGFTHAGNTLGVSTRDAMEKIISRLPDVGEAWRIPYFRAAQDDRLALVMASHGQRLATRILNDARPTLLILADDQPAATGPAGWPQAKKLMAWARGVILHAAAADASYSQIAVTGTIDTGRMLMVECSSRHHPEWLALALPQRERRHLPILNILPTNGLHPTGYHAGVVRQ
jgi:hypothetical protein